VRRQRRLNISGLSILSRTPCCNDARYVFFESVNRDPWGGAGNHSLCRIDQALVEIVRRKKSGDKGTQPFVKHAARTSRLLSSSEVASTGIFSPYNASQCTLVAISLTCIQCLLLLCFSKQSW